jgi:hypothetical protein
MVTLNRHPMGGLMVEKLKSPATLAALIGLVGTMLTICGGLTSAGVSAAMKIYEIGQEKQHIDVAPPSGEEPLNIDTGGIFISREEAAALDPETYFVELERGLAIHRPFPGWDALEELTIGEALAAEGTTIPTSSLSDQPVYRIRYGEPIEIQADRQTLVNGQPLPEDVLNSIERLHGPPPWTQAYYSQVTVNVFGRPVAEGLGIGDLPDLLMTLAPLSGGRVNRLVAEDGSDFMVMQSSKAFDGVRVAGEEAAFTLETWLLLAEAEGAYYAVEIAYTQESGQPLQVWDDLQAYLDSFRVIQ